MSMRNIYKSFPIAPTTTPLFNNMGQLSWPELVGREGTYAVQYIKEKTGKCSLNLNEKILFII